LTVGAGRPPVEVAKKPALVEPGTQLTDNGLELRQSLYSPPGVYPEPDSRIVVPGRPEDGESPTVGTGIVTLSVSQALVAAESKESPL
jgi:hypothetical protein